MASQQLLVALSGDIYQGDPIASIQVDGANPIAFPISAQNAHGQVQPVALSGDWDSGAHSVKVTFTNDLYHGTSATDRNLYLKGLTWGGVFFPCSASLLSQGQSATVQIPAGTGASVAPPAPAPAPAPVAPAPAPVPVSYSTPTFQDEFTSLSLLSFDGSHWPPLLPARGNWATCFYYGWPTNSGTPADLSGAAARLETGNKEAQCYEDGGVVLVPGGGVALVATRSSANHFQQPWTSGMLAQNIGLAQTYGYSEVVAIMPAGKGFWFGAWLLSGAAGLPWPPEIDGVEYVALDANNNATTTAIHCNVIQNAGAGNGGFVTVGSDVTAAPHKYGWNVTPTVTEFFFDDALVMTQPTPNQISAGDPLYLLVNLAVGGPGSWPGEPDPSVSMAEVVIKRISQYAAGSWGSSAIPLTPPASA